jgi:hypothetical protein
MAVLTAVALLVAVRDGVPPGVADPMDVGDTVGVAEAATVGVSVPGCCGGRLGGEYAETAAGRALKPASATKRSSRRVRGENGRVISLM